MSGGSLPDERLTVARRALDEALEKYRHLEERLTVVEATTERQRKGFTRAVYIAEHLFQMVPRAVWRDHGGDDMQGHYEGDYHAEKVQEELKQLAALSVGEEQ